MTDIISLLIDADIIAHEAASAAMREVEWEPDCWSLWMNIEEAVRIVQHEINRITPSNAPVSIALCFSSRPYFRSGIFPEYKANRKSRRVPGFLALIERLKLMHDSWAIPGLEADDVMGVLSTSESIMVSVDKDMRTVPGTHLNPATGQIAFIDKEEADYNFLCQALTGDAGDGYPGCPGIGPVRAEKILRSSPTWKTVCQEYERAKLTTEDALTQARLARILRPGEFNWTTREPILWSPEAKNYSSSFQ